MSSDEIKYLIIGRGFAGWHGKAIGDDRGLISSSGGALESYTENADDGVLVYDASETDFKSFSQLVISGPMVDVTLDSGKRDIFSDEDRRRAAELEPALGGSFKTLARMSQNSKFRGFDSVSVEEYEVILRKVPGIKIGRVAGGKVIWEDL